MGVNHAVFVFVKEFVGGLLADAFGRDATFATGACGVKTLRSPPDGRRAGFGRPEAASG